MNWRNKHEACAEYKRLDSKFKTSPDSPLHHDNRCALCTGHPVGDNPLTTIPLVLAPPAAKNHEPVCGASTSDPSGGGDVYCTIKPHGRSQLHVSHGIAGAVTWGD